MVDCTQLIIDYLLENGNLVTLLGGPNVFGSALPEKFDPTVQPGVTVATEGGPPPFQEAPIATSRVKVRYWAGINQAPLARQLYIEGSTWLHGKNSIDLSPDGFILILQESVGGQDLTDPDEGYSTVVAWYEVTARASLPDDGSLIVDGGTF